MSSLRRRHSQSPATAAAPLDVDDLLSEILLRLSPQPSSLPRASLVCKRWRLLVSDPRFLRRFRIHHRGNPPLLGCFDTGNSSLAFRPAMEPPNRIPPERFSLQRDGSNSFMSLGCRHGLVLISALTQHQFVVWDPVTGDQHQIAIPPGFDPETTEITGSVLRSAGDVHFQVVFVGSSDGHALACLYSSETGVWGDLASTPLPSNDDPGSEYYLMLWGTRVSREPAVLVGGSLYWICRNYTTACSGILEFDLQMQSLDVIQVPVDVVEDACNFKIIRADGGVLGFLFVSDFTAQIWKIDCDGVASWVLGRTIELDKLLSLDSEVQDNIMIVGYAEENNAVFLWVYTGIYEVQLQTLQFKLFRTNILKHYHPFESVYTAETDIGNEPHGAELLHNA